MSLRSIPTQGKALEALLRRIVQQVKVVQGYPDGKPGASHDVPMSIGGYTLSEDDDGNLTAVCDATGNATVIATP